MPLDCAGFAISVQVADDGKSSSDLLLNGSDLQHSGGLAVDIVHCTLTDLVVESQSSSSLFLHPSSEMQLQRSTSVAHSQLIHESCSGVSDLSVNVHNLHD